MIINMPKYQWEELYYAYRPTTDPTDTYVAGDGCIIAWLNGHLLRLFGWASWNPGEWNSKCTTNEVWQYDLTGAPPTKLLPHDDALPSGTTRPRRRHTPAYCRCVINGIDYLYVVGGDPFDHLGDPAPWKQGIYTPYPKDVWRTADGVHWECMNNATPWSTRVLGVLGSIGSTLYFMGGQTDITDNTSGSSEVWRSTDGGATWVQLANAPWTPRGGVYGPKEWNGKLWLVGGFVYGTPYLYRQEVWSFDGVTWTSHTVPPWSGKAYMSCEVWDERLWAIGGADGVNTNELWWTVDGDNWTREIGLPEDSHADGTCVLTIAQAESLGDPSLAALYYSPGNFGCISFVRFLTKLTVAIHEIPVDPNTW